MFGHCLNCSHAINDLYCHKVFCILRSIDDHQTSYVKSTDGCVRYSDRRPKQEKLHFGIPVQLTFNFQ